MFPFLSGLKRKGIQGEPNVLKIAQKGLKTCFVSFSESSKVGKFSLSKTFWLPLYTRDRGVLCSFQCEKTVLNLPTRTCQAGRRRRTSISSLPFCPGKKRNIFLLNVYAKAFPHTEKYSSFLSPWKYRRPHIASIPIIQRVTPRLAREIIPFVVELKGHSWENTSQANIHGENNERTREIYEGGGEGNTLLCIIGPFIPPSPPPRNSTDTHSAVYVCGMCRWQIAALH